MQTARQFDELVPRKKSSGFGWQSDLFQARMVTAMQIALTRLKARYWQIGCRPSVTVRWAIMLPNVIHTYTLEGDTNL